MARDAVDTGLHTMTGGRIKRIRDYIGDETFMLTYGDGVSNVDLDALVAFHKAARQDRDPDRRQHWTAFRCHGC